MREKAYRLVKKGINKPEAIPRFIIEKTWTFWERFGFHIVPNHYYYPIPTTKELLKRKPWQRPYPTTGIDLNDESQLELLNQISEYLSKYTPRGPGFPSNGDGSVLYGMIRHVKPKTVIEVGSGTSTEIIDEAISKNDQGTEIIAIEPHPDDELTELAKNSDNIQLKPSKAETVPVEFFQKLNAGDVLFIDSTHVVTAGNDVAHLFLRVLPELPKGVYVHIHDIKFPQEYPKEWLVDSHFFWSEQYVLQAFLHFNDKYSIVWAGNYMSENYGDKLKGTLPDYSAGDGCPGSFWIKRTRA